MHVELIPVTRIRCNQRYFRERLPGTSLHPFIANIVLPKLLRAADLIKELSAGKYELVLWDAHRSPDTQSAIFDRYRDQVCKGHPDWSKRRIRRQTEVFVRSPYSIFPHGTGGAVDCTLAENGREAVMPTDFDDFTERAASDYFLKHPPSNSEDAAIAERVHILQTALKRSDFAGIRKEWWHFEIYTKHWAKMTGQNALLDQVLHAPTIESSASLTRLAPCRQPVLETGAAQAFTDHRHRAASLNHERPGHYYFRSSSPTTTAFSEALGREVDAINVGLTCSGLSACLLALRTFAPPGSTVLYDSKIYYEVQAGIKLEAERHWNLCEVDCLDFAKLRRTVLQVRPNVLYIDNPRNWWLDSFGLSNIAQLCREVNAKLLVDISIQPLQNALGRGADVALLSLSKYPSAGMEGGGAILTNDAELSHQVSRTLAREGQVLSAHAAAAIWPQILTMRDRLSAISNKAASIKSALDTHPQIRQVRLPDAKLLGGLCGGQLTFHLRDQRLGWQIEELIGMHSLMPDFTLSSACTFGSTLTTFEHFSSNVRKRFELRRDATNEVLIPPDLCRLGIGSASANAILHDLTWVLNTAA